MASKFQAPRGTHDVLPSESWRWQRVEREFLEFAGRFGYVEIRTPAFEDTDLFTRTSGETSDIVTKEMYTFRDKGERSLSLKPEGTAPAVRSYLEHNLGAAGAITRLAYITQAFRYERPQKGRFRQHHQFGIECIGPASVRADVEVIEVAIGFLRHLGLTGLVVSVNSLGREATREAYRTAILEHAHSYLADLEAEVRARYEKNPLRLLDSKDPDAVAMVAEAPSVLEFLEPESRARFEALQDGLGRAGVAFEVKPQIVRGLDYYTDTVFEIVSDDLGAQSAVCGGGRYDHLVQRIGGPVTPAAGFGIGIERLLMLLEGAGLLSVAPSEGVFVVAADETAYSEAEALARELRAAGRVAVIDLEFRSLKSQIRQADVRGATHALILGPDERAAGGVTVRNLATSEQQMVSRTEVLDALA